MDRILAIWTKLAARIRGLRVQLRLCLRMSVAAVLTYLLSQALHLPLPLWAVLTSVIVTQMSVGKSLKATVDYMEGTLGGAVYSGIVGALFPQAGGIAIPLMLAVAVAPLALLAATSSRFAAAPFTAVMVLLIPSMTHVSPVYSAFYRVVEVALGCVVAVCVSLLLLPEHAHNLVVQSAARMLKRMGRVLPELVAGLREKQDFTKIAHIQDNIGKAFIELNSTTAEAKRERVPYLYGEPDPQPLVDSLLRLRHDLVMIGRASVTPFPPAFLERLGGTIAELSETAAEYLRSTGAAIEARRRPPSLARFEAALDSYTVAFAQTRRDGLTRTLSAEAAEQIFAFGFAVEQLHQNFKDLRRCTEQIAHLDQVRAPAEA
ncbi:MAG: FUSC family protein [Methylovirgula sp.]